jgi:uncharacterized membrane protein
MKFSPTLQKGIAFLIGAVLFGVIAYTAFSDQKGVQLALLVVAIIDMLLATVFIAKAFRE